ncbi:SpaA isopeptide-forming pilin-related protein [Gemmiger formicilis]|uniref:SpaA isopeptide-forming pilin-related protein n=2 Tax=Bacillota TaxID=1239 RepID=UPI0022E8B56F|nr:SpaA isopeptide-forming pilin-related protein [Gemmiger formicilis]
MQYKLKHRLSAALMAGAMCCTMIPAASADEIATPETVDTAVPEVTDSVTPALSQITENLYNDLPDAPTGSYIGSMGLPVATGETKISISSWVSDLYDGVDAHMDADALSEDETTIIVGKGSDSDYAVVPLLVQTEYPADGATSEIILPDGVELLSYASTDYDLIPADEAEQTKILHQTYAEQSAAATGLYVKTSSDFTAQFIYTAPDGEQLQKSLHVQLSDEAAPTQLYADNGIATLAAGPTPPYATGKITSIAKEGGTWLIWFNGQEAYCCSHGLNGQPKGCPTYSFSHVSRLEPGQYTPGNHYANQVNIWGGLGQLSLDMLDDRPVVASLEYDPEGCEEQPDILGSLYDETQQWIMENYPDSYAAQTYIAAAEELVNGTDAQSGENGYYTYIYNPPAGYAWQVVALVGEEIAGGTEIPDVPSVPEPKYYSAAWTAPAQTAGGSFDLTFTVNTDKYQLNTLEKVDGAAITVTPSQTGGSVDGGSWQMSPAAAQTITTGGHTQDDNFHLNGGDGSATWTVHYEVSKTSTSTLSGQEGPFTSQAEADAAAEAAKNAAIGQLQNEAQGMVDAAIASARAQLANITFSYDEITIPHGFESTTGALGSHQTITVPANSSNDYKMQNDEWSVKVSIDKIDSETKQRIKGDAEFKIFEWDTVNQRYIPFGGYNRYKVERQADGTYKVINHSDYAGGSDDLFYTQRNEGKFVIVESRAPSGYYGDWTDVTKPGTAGSVLGKRAYAFEITKALDGQTIWLGNADYNADITTANSGGTLIDTGEGIVTITFGSRNADKTYTTDPTGIASNEDSYTMHADVDTMQNDRTLGSITLSKADFDAARYLAAGSNGDSTLEGAVYDLYAAEDILHPNGVSGIVDYSKITDANGTPIWHTTVLTNGAWKSDYLPVLKKDHLVASAAIKDGKLAFANLYLGRYYLVERATGIVIPVDFNGQYYLFGKYPLLNKKLEPTGSYAALAGNGTEYTDYVYRNQYSAVAESRALDGSKTYDGYYLSFAKGYLCDEVNHYQSLTYADESTYVVRDEDQTQDEVLKSGFSLQKLVSTTGQPSPAIKLGGAGFKVYRVSLLSKADQFTKNADGSYDAASILEAYRKSSYDQDTLKFDFSNEEQAVATMYESDTTSVTRYNATLTADSDFANGQGLGWVPTNNSQEYRLSEIFTNEEGILRVQGLPNGQYIVVETTVPKDVFQAEPFLVTVNASSPQSGFTVPAGSVTTPSGSYMTYNILDEELEGYLQLVKIDIETGKPVKIADTTFSLYYIAEDGRETLVEMNDPKSGNAWAKTSTFYTDSNGEMKTPEKLPLGRYRIVEIEGPRGYFNDRQYNVVFELTSDRVYQVSGGSADSMDDYVITENYYNHETLGQIKIRKIGNVLTGYENGQFVYESDNLANATYEIHAQGDIPTPDNQGTLWYADGDLVATVTTAEDGQVDEVRFSPTRTTATYDFLKVTHDGTKGEVTITLPLGTYTISEVQAPYGFVHTDHTYTVVLDWDNQYNDLVLAKTIIDHTQDGDVVYDYSIINIGNASAEQIEKQVLAFENARVLPVVEEGKVGVGLYKLDRDTCDFTDEAPYTDGCKTRASLLNGGSNRADIPADAKMVAGAVYELYTADDIYSISGNLLAAADTLLGTATTDENGLAYFDVDVPLRGESYGSSVAPDWTTNSGRYYLREISVPDGYLIEQSVIPVEFTYENQFIAWQIVDCLHSDKQTTVEIDKRTFASDSDTTFALPGATLTVTDWNGNVVDSWESSDTAHVIRGLHLSHDFAGNRDTTKIYTLSETRPADGYTTARSIQFRLEQATDDNGYLQETAVWVLHESEDAEYQSGSIISPIAFSDDSVATISAKLRAFWDRLLGQNPDADGVVIANWYCVNGTLVVNFTDVANDRAISKCLRESDFNGLTFDNVYLNGASAPAFFADKQVADKPDDAEITYSASWILLKDSDGFNQTVTMLDAPTRVKISKADITTHEEIPGATLRVLDKDGIVVDEWVSEDAPHYMEAVLVAGETYTLKETLVPDNSGYVPANSIQFTVEDDGKIQHVFMQDNYTKVQISKTDIATGKEISGAKLKITDADGKSIAEWITDGTPHYMERIPMGTYTLTETMAPTEQGYVRAESVTFEVGPTGGIQRVEMKDDFTKVEISKADMTDGRELPGAKLKITDASGNIIAEWETNGQPHRIERLKPGEYTLIETAAPAGYLLGEEVHFTVQETGEIQKVTMYDAPAHSLILTKRDIATNAKLADARLTIRDAYGTTIERWTTTDGDHAIRVLPERSAAKDPHKNLLLLSDDTSEHVYTMVEELAPDGYLVAESITFKIMQMNDALVVFIWQDGGWQKSSEGYLAMYDERTDTPVPLMKTFPQTGSIL